MTPAEALLAQAAFLLDAEVEEEGSDEAVSEIRRMAAELAPPEPAQKGGKKPPSE